MNKSYIDLVLEEVPNLDIDKFISAWHNNEGANQHLNEYLGMTWDQYKRWAKDESLLPSILEEIRQSKNTK